MTYNIHSCIGADGRSSSQRIADVILRAGADIVALQEVDRGLRRTGLADQAREIAGNLGMYFCFHPSLFREEGAYGIAILSRFPLYRVQSGELPALPERKRREPRGALWVQVHFPAAVVQVINTHFGLHRLERNLQLMELLGPLWLDQSTCTPPCIVCGDFNASPRSLVYRRLTKRLIDVQGHAAGWRPRKTWPSKYPIARIDHIFVSPDCTVEQVSVVRDELTCQASDHLPLVASVRFDLSEGLEPSK